MICLLETWDLDFLSRPTALLPMWTWLCKKKHGGLEALPEKASLETASRRSMTVGIRQIVPEARESLTGCVALGESYNVSECQFVFL